jgi:hypothetical protein
VVRLVSLLTSPVPSGAAATIGLASFLGPRRIPPGARPRAASTAATPDADAPLDVVALTR